MQILVTGATGAVGRPLTMTLRGAGHDVVAATRRPDDYAGDARPVRVDLDDHQAELERDMAGADAAYYLVHALDDRDFVAIDRRRAERFAAAWGPDRPVIYLGGLGGASTGSDHLRSRHEVGEILRARCWTVELRASLVIGPDSLSFQLLRDVGRVAGRSLVPVAVPKAATTRTQPIAQADLTATLVAALDLAPGCYDIGGPDVVTFAELIERSAAAQGRTLKAVPSLPIGADWLGPGAALVAETDPWATTALLASMSTETVVDDRRRPPGIDQPTDLDTAIKAALAEPGAEAVR